jgi:hypothetical protein
MRATCRQELQHLLTMFVSLRLKDQASVRPGSKKSQSRQPRLFPFAQAIEYFANYAVQTIRRFARRHARLPGHSSGDFRFPHPITL